MASTRRHSFLQLRSALLRRSACLALGATTFLILSMPSVNTYAKGPSLEETRDFIVLKLSGVSASSRVHCDRECGGFVETAWQNWIAKSSSFCSVEVVQTVDVTKSLSPTCVWASDVIGDERWSDVAYRREYHFRLDFGSIARDDITVEPATPENSQCFLIKPDVPYVVRLSFTKGVYVNVRLKATGSGTGHKTVSEQDWTDTWSTDSLTVGSGDTAEKLARAFKHAATVCGALHR